MDGFVVVVVVLGRTEEVDCDWQWFDIGNSICLYVYV